MPLVQTNFIFLNYLDSSHQSSAAPDSLFALPGQLRVSGAQAPIIASEFDLTLALEIKPRGIVGFFEYSIDLFDESSIERMAVHLQNLMSAVIDNTDAPVATLDLLTPQERAEARIKARGGATSYPELYVLDERMQSPPSGASGELYIGGEQLARGYWNQPELTAERFVPHPFSREAGARLFRTGDAARYLSDGRIEYVVGEVVNRS
jgi:non-ribosomal peptide synthetase component F